MKMNHEEKLKFDFLLKLKSFTSTLKDYIAYDNNQWRIKGFIDVFKNVYTISTDTKILSKILEIHIFPKIFEFAENNDFDIVLADHQNYYPDISLVSKENPRNKFAVDLKTTYRLEKKPEFCNGFTLGSHGKYFIDRKSTKNIQFPYSEYLGHYCLGIIYSRNIMKKLDDINIYTLNDLEFIPSVIKDFVFFACEKWQIASDKGGSGNTANIGSIKKIDDIINGKGTFTELGEEWFDDYWMNFGKIRIKDEKGSTKLINNIKNFLIYRGYRNKYND